MTGSAPALRLLPPPLATTAVVLLALAIGPAEAAEIRTVDLRGIEARSAALLLSGQEAEGLEASLLARSLPATEAGGSILVVADLPGASLPGEEPAAGMIVEVYGYALDGSGQPRATLTRAFSLDLEERGAWLETGGVKFVGRLDLPAGAAAEVVRLLVLHRASGRFTLRTLPLATGVSADPPAGPLLLLERADPWLLASDPDAGGLFAGGPLLPATRLLASAGGSLAVGLPAGAVGEFSGRILDLGGSSLGDLDLRLEAAAGDRPGRLLVDLSTWSPGGYLLEIDAGMGAAPALRLPLELVPERLPEGTAWFQRSAARREPESRPAARAPAAGRSAMAQLALAAYARAFEAWQAGDLPAALTELRRFEVGARASATTPSLSIEEGQVRAAAELVDRDGEALVPLMALHERLSRLYQAAGRLRLATHARRLASEFARLYAARGGREAGRIAALVPVSLGGMRQELGTRIAAQTTFEHALELDPTQPAALLCLAALHESLAHHETAVELLRRLERTGAMTPAARIRLAVNLGRTGATRQALERLAELADAKPDWVSRLAYQERARLLAEGKRGDEALAVLLEARERYPDDQGLTIQQAALLDELGKPLAGQRVLESIDEITGDRGDSPRLRYSTLPARAIEAARRRLAEAATERLATVLESARAIQTGPAP